MSGRILVGTASWSDPEFVRDWYPRGMPAGDRLSWYAEQLRFVELNSSFYGIPNRRQVERWCAQTPPGFTFDVKLHKLLSRHAAKPDSLLPELRKLADVRNGNVVLTPELEHAVAERFLAEIEPFMATGKLGALLLQLSPSFSPRAHRLEELDPLCAQLTCTAPLAIELRNRNWVTGLQLEKTLAHFAEKKLPLVLVDAPLSEHFTVMPRFDAVTARALSYLRLHGRNERAYVTGKTVATRFDYNYSDAELEEVAERVTRLAQEAQELHVVFNNNRSHYAPKAALRFQHIVAQG